MQPIARDKHLTKRQVIEISHVDLVRWAISADVTRGDSQIEKQIDR
jgi:hypothetical protein